VILRFFLTLLALGYLYTSGHQSIKLSSSDLRTSSDYMNIHSPHTCRITMSSTEIISLSRQVDFTQENIGLLYTISVIIPYYMVHIYINLLAELSRMDELIQNTHENDLSITKMFPFLVDEYQTHL
jgi:hypothetical protein